MKKEIGKWLMDIAKYLATAVLITSIIGDFEQKWAMYLIATVTFILSLGFGLLLISEKQSKLK